MNILKCEYILEIKFCFLKNMSTQRKIHACYRKNIEIYLYQIISYKNERNGKINIVKNNVSCKILVKK